MREKEPHDIIEGVFLARHFDLRDMQSSLDVCSTGRDGHPLAVHAVDPVSPPVQGGRGPTFLIVIGMQSPPDLFVGGIRMGLTLAHVCF